MKREPWHRYFLQTLEAAASLAMQHRAWVEGMRDECPEPVELICQLFNDSALDVLLERGEVFSPATDAELRELRLLVGKIDVEDAAWKLLSNRRWILFTQRAARVLGMVRADLAK